MLINYESYRNTQLYMEIRNHSKPNKHLWDFCVLFLRLCLIFRYVQIKVREWKWGGETDHISLYICLKFRIRKYYNYKFINDIIIW